MSARSLALAGSTIVAILAIPAAADECSDYRAAFVLSEAASRASTEHSAWLAEDMSRFHERHRPEYGEAELRAYRALADAAPSGSTHHRPRPRSRGSRDPCNRRGAGHHRLGKIPDGSGTWRDFSRQSGGIPVGRADLGDCLWQTIRGVPRREGGLSRCLAFHLLRARLRA